MISLRTSKNEVHHNNRYYLTPKSIYFIKYPNQVPWLILMVGNLLEKSLALAAILIAT